jgi:hypothetical protein
MTSSSLLPTRFDSGTRHPTNKDSQDALPSLFDSASSIKSLTIGCKNPRSLPTFISSIDTLEELNIADVSGQPDKFAKTSARLWKAILEHEDTLKKLTMGAPPRLAECSLQECFVNENGKTTHFPSTTRTKGEGCFWSVQQLEQVRDGFAALEHLGVDVTVEEIDTLLQGLSSSHSVNLSTRLIDPSKAPILSSLVEITHIPSIKISIIIPDEETPFINDAEREDNWDCSFTPGGLVEEKCEDLAKLLFKEFFTRNEVGTQQLKVLEICFITLASWDRAQYYAVKRSLFVLKGNKKPVVQFVNKEWEEWEEEGDCKNGCVPR